MSTIQSQTTKKAQHGVVPRFYDLKAVMTTLGISRSTVWKMVETSHFPKPVQLFSRRIAWPDHEVEKMVTLLSADLPKDELVKRVEEIHAARKELAK
ncbi:helix-turn-helix transcriptional regulator [Vibrio parahaemolyticus]|uniref:helix-turn-helix transcriptional regulator n=1 Tax=Vibrio parahaemolyticus TaxID=670 RepID=UPI00215BE8FD|nr:AlpA family phage regulatory protein [Vibrio parahaemolyticus]EHR5320633.1 AlpA family phage regulatory protein [Vibrio parahaemolyticus]MCR9856722.1 AlpA family phage regulatory protein [Vibrio parahaemolyticus]MDF4659724.1 AlpA family phage regulatory protein [Vibrio parahaemolyticus]